MYDMDTCGAYVGATVITWVNSTGSIYFPTDVFRRHVEYNTVCQCTISLAIYNKP
jgi:hypothetical protein